MNKILSEREVRRSIIKFLSRNGWGLNLREKETREHGVDIKVRHNKYARYFLIETKGESSAASARQQREVAFVYSLGQIVSRMDTNARYYYGLGLPQSIANIAIRRIPWRLAKRLLLYVFSVSSDGKVRKYDWKALKTIQVKY